MTQRSDDYHAALASAPRRRVLDALRHAPRPLDAGAIATLLDVHVTTARFHLDQLVTAGLAHRRIGSEPRRGRPRVLYVSAGAARDDDSREQLIEVLATSLADRDDGVSESVQAGWRWADQLGVPTSDAPEAGMVAALEQLGFEPELDAEQPTAAEEIRLHACPFRAAARDHPDIVCSVHRGLIDRLLQNAAAEPRLLPFVEPELCVITLTRLP